MDDKVLLYSCSGTHSQNIFLSPQRSFLTISKQILTFEGEPKYLETAITRVIPEHSGVTFRSTPGVGWGRELQPLGCCVVGTQLVVSGQGFRENKV